MKNRLTALAIAAALCGLAAAAQAHGPEFKLRPEIQKAVNELKLDKEWECRDAVEKLIRPRITMTDDEAFVAGNECRIIARCRMEAQIPKADGSAPSNTEIRAAFLNCLERDKYEMCMQAAIWNHSGNLDMTEAEREKAVQADYDACVEKRKKGKPHDPRAE